VYRNGRFFDQSGKGYGVTAPSRARRSFLLGNLVKVYMRNFRLIFCLLVFGMLCSGQLLGAESQAGDRHTTTDWDLKPSLKYDTLCLMNALSGDPYYLHYYQAEFDHFNPLFTPAERASFQQLKAIIKDGEGSIISAKLALYFSVTQDETLEQMIQTTQDSAHMRSALMETTYWSPEGWAAYEKARPHLEDSLKALQRVGFPQYWETNARPRIEKRIAELNQTMPGYNVIPAIEDKLGKPLPSNRITIYLLAYSEPHGIKITGTRFITHVSYPFRIVLHNAVHEMMHPPYDKNDPAVASAIEQLGRDALIRDKVENHNKSFGYNFVPGYVEEDSVQALEEIVCEQFGVERNSQEYWKAQDDGIHVLAVAIYVDYKRALHDSKTAIPYSQWLVKAVRNGDLQGTKLAETNQKFFAASR